jgi:hypothetical protein
MISQADIVAKLADKGWRMRNLYQILPEDDADGGMIPFVLRAEQEQYLRERHHRNMTPKARKLGMSTLIVIDYLDECITTPKTHCAHVDFKEDDAFKKLDIARMAWKSGPSHPNPVIALIWRYIHEHNPLISEATGCLQWANGSKQEAGTSFMGGTPRRLHWSEAGPMSAQAPDRARKVKRGSLNAIGAGGIIDIETTMEGGEGTIARDIFDLALASVGKPLTRMDWRLHFFPWFGHPSYDLPGHVPNLDDTHKYIAEMRTKHGIELPMSRWAWYEKKKLEQKEDIWTQFPTIAEECVRAIVSGQIFPDMVTLRSKGRVRPLSIEDRHPLFTFWDIGNDGLAVWLGQMPSRDILWHRFKLVTGQGATAAAELIREFEGEFGRTIAKHFFPHDVDYRDKGYSKTYRQQLIEAGIPNHKIITVPIAGDKWDAINNVRDRISRFWFDESCEERQRDAFGEEMPSGVQCLLNYRTKPKAANGELRPYPLHDDHSHGADAMLTFGCADEMGFLNASYSNEEPAWLRRRGMRQAGDFVG